MKHSNPISLFSFQDIITSLTGIMIVVVLVIILQLVETTAVVTAKSSQQPEYVALKEEYETLQKNKLELTAKLAASQNKRADFADISLPELREMIRQQLKEAALQEALLEEKSGELDKLGKAVKTLEEHDSSLKKEFNELTRAENRVLELQSVFLALQNKQKQVEEMIEKKKKMLRIEFSGEISRTPILIECNPWGFRAARSQEQKITTFGDPKTSAFSQISPLISWLKNQSLSDMYPVLLIREGALDSAGNLEGQLYKELPGVPIGKEPLITGEECF